MLVMDSIVGLAGGAASSHMGGGDSFVDRLNCRYTVMLLTAFCLLITTKHYVGDPINCWCPAHFTSSHVAFTDSVCWTTGTYYLPESHIYIPRRDEQKQMVSYYQWVPLILIVMAILFYLPRMLWMVLNKVTGVAVSTITEAAMEHQRKSDAEEREKQMSHMTNHLGRVFTESMHGTGRHRFRTVRKALYAVRGIRLTVAYIFIKCLYVANVVGQFLMLDIFLGIDYHGYGVHIFERLFQGESWQTSHRFPRVTLCDIYVRVLGNVQRYTIQCSLPMNLVNEFIFIFIWFWMIFVFVANVGSLLKWAFICLFTSRQVDYTQARLSIMSIFESKNGEEAEELDQTEVRKFVRNFLERDGFLMIRLVSHNTSDITATELLYNLWLYYLAHEDSIQNVYKGSKTGQRSGVVKKGRGQSKDLESGVKKCKTDTAQSSSLLDQNQNS